jgi:hypothetical protein
MSYRVVCISRTVAAGGEHVGHLVAQRLGFRYIDDEVITLASQKAGVDPAIVVKAEHHSSLLTRLMDALVAPPMKVEGYLSKRGTTDYYASTEVRPSLAPPQEALRRLIQETILEIARRGDAVIVAHAASMALAREKSVLRVLVTASVKTRTQRLWLTTRLLGEAESTRAVADSDRERQRYLERFFDVKEELPTYYDLVVNTDVLRIEQAVAAIVAAASE